MTFTQIPDHFAPLGRELRYTVAAEATGVIDLRIIDAGSGTLLGAKRFAAAATASFDAAPCLRRAVHFTPTTGGTGFHTPVGRSTLVLVEARTTLAGAASPLVVSSPERSFLPIREIVVAPALMTTMPLMRLIASGESDELTLCTEQVCTVTVTARAGETKRTETYRAKAGGMHLFRLDTADFPGAETLTVDAGGCGEVAYTVMGPVRGAHRLAWRSSAGSIEHYTFPVERSEVVEAAKTRAFGAGGNCITRATGRRRKLLVSAYAPRPTIESLSGILVSPQVWLVENGTYTPVDVVTESAVVHRYRAVSCLEVEICSNPTTGTPWN